jgi:hypothetical protein
MTRIALATALVFAAGTAFAAPSSFDVDLNTLTPADRAVAEQIIHSGDSAAEINGKLNAILG